PLLVDLRTLEVVHAETDLLVLPWPVRAQAAVARCPRLRVVARLEEADALHDRPELVLVVAVCVQRRDAEVPRRLIRRVVRALAAGLAGQRREECPRLAVVATLEDARRLDTGEHTAVRSGERRDLRQLAPVLVREAFARERPRLAEVLAAPDRRAMPLAGRGREDRAGARLHERVIDRPALAKRPARRPLAAVGIALEDEQPFPGSDEQQRTRHPLHLRQTTSFILVQTAAVRKTHRRSLNRYCEVPPQCPRSSAGAAAAPSRRRSDDAGGARFAGHSSGRRRGSAGRSSGGASAGARGGVRRRSPRARPRRRARARPRSARRGPDRRRVGDSRARSRGSTSRASSRGCRSRCARTAAARRGCAARPGRPSRTPFLHRTTPAAARGSASTRTPTESRAATPGSHRRPGGG